MDTQPQTSQHDADARPHHDAQPRDEQQSQPGAGASLDVLILAAGLGTRMRSATAKVLHKLGGRPLIAHVCRTARALVREIGRASCRERAEISVVAVSL